MVATGHVHTVVHHLPVRFALLGHAHRIWRLAKVGRWRWVWCRWTWFVGNKVPDQNRRDGQHGQGNDHADRYFLRLGAHFLYSKKIMEETIEQDDLFVALFVIGEIKPKDKLAIYDNHITIHPSNNFFQKWITRMRRTIWFESKKLSYEFIQVCIKSLEHHVKVLLEQKDTITLKRLVAYVENTKEGLQNLSHTYDDDVNMKGKLKRQVEKLGLQKDKIHAFLDKIGKLDGLEGM